MLSPISWGQIFDTARVVKLQRLPRPIMRFVDAEHIVGEVELNCFAPSVASYLSID